MNQAAVINQVLLGGSQLQFNLLIFCRRGRTLRSVLTDVGALFLTDEGFTEVGRELVADVAIAGTFFDSCLLAHGCLKYLANRFNCQQTGM